MRFGLLAVLWVVLDVFPGSISCCRPSSTAGPCSTSCDCTQTATAPLKCPGEWSCNTDKICEYTCRDVCGAASGTDAGCATPLTCVGSTCSDRASCP